MRFLLLLLPLCVSAGALAESFGNEPGAAWAETPRGRFECRNDASTRYLQRITLGSALLYQERGSNNPQGNGGPRLANGISSYDPGCPEIVANQGGRLVIVRATQPPHYGGSGYALIDFNRPDLPVIELGQGQDPRDAKIRNRLAWSDSGLSLKFFGYLAEEESAARNAPPPKAHEVRLQFSSGKLEVVQ